MTSLLRRVAPRFVEVLTSPRTRALQGALREGARRIRGEPHRVRYFHQVDDPYSHLAAQVLVPLCARYDVVLEPHLVGRPSEAAAPERERLEAFARKDAADVAPGYGLSFPGKAGAPSVQAVDQASRILVAAAASGSFAAVAPRVGTALWQEGMSGLDRLAREHATADASAAREATARGTALRERLGHYLGAMFHHGGVWYWGVDRLQHLEGRLREVGALRPGADPSPLAPRPAPEALPVAPSRNRVGLEFFLSLRSPYTYIAMERVHALARRLPVDLALRPVLPMVMRGLPVPAPKRRYILLDTKREAEAAGVPFGRVCDPVGRPVERGFSLYLFARERGRAAQYLLAFARAAFAEGVDTGTDAGLRHVVEGAGLSWAEARPRLDADGWRDELESNRRTLLDAGLWGVPCFRVVGPGAEPDFWTWGQDRLWCVENEVRRRAGAPSGAPGA